MDTSLRARVGAVSRWHPQAPELVEWRSRLALDAIREDIYRRLITSHRHALGRELLFGDGEDGDDS